MSKFFTTLTMLAFCLPVAPLQADEQGEQEEVWRLLASQSQASGEFVQELSDEEGELLERSRGRYAVLRPGYFRWEISSPDQQLIVVSGSKLWHYDRDLAAATRRDTSENREFTPLELLAGESDELKEKFNTQTIGPSQVRLIPTFPQAGFAWVEVTWERNAVIAMVVEDRSGQLISLALTPDLEPVELTATDFDFVPPAGVDVYEPSDY
ncbi:outer membrane lipoprotein chaperone LolA [Congregibacter brevis]|uniref:Outer-membrane lipoprotein carrier protein n=1 Tax=Congregibacter brevis TaxID=3081201 RepID=A0ABZ0IA40_9GAMM|nr:outer membrane lipoprotein chaperone LolA [Congregibacter sp. IMCC45268]